MRLQTREDNFEFQMEDCVVQLKEYLEIDEMTDEILWDNIEEFGKIVYDRISESIGFESVGVEEIL